MRVLLVDADSKIPNLALMKLSTFYKDMGDEVILLRLNIPYFPYRRKQMQTIPEGNYDKVLCSIVFTPTVKFLKKTNKTEYGGSGVDLVKTLPDSIEKLPPDYSIYPDNDTSYGFISRGCIRNCWFCIVPKKEGKLRQVATVKEIIKHDKVKFLDNNFLALPNHESILKELVDMQIKCQFNQGLDIRLVTKRNSKLLSILNYIGDYLFAFDDISYLNSIECGVALLKWRKPWQLKFFVYVHPKMKLDNIIKRIMWLRKEKCLPYIMRDLSCWGSKYESFYTDLAAWCNQPNLIKTMPFEEYIQKRHPRNKDRIKYSTTLYKKYGGVK